LPPLSTAARVGYAMGLRALMMAEYMPSATSWVGVISTSTNPASANPCLYSVKDSAPATQPTQLPRSARSAGLRWSSATTSDTPTRPPGRRTRCIEAKTAGLSSDRLITQLEITTSMVLSGSGMSSMCPRRNSTFVAPASAALRRASSSISSVMSSPYALPVGPTLRAESSTSMPPPEPRSSTVSPGLRSATISGLPQPRLASRAAAGSSALSAAEYNSEPNPSPASAAGPQQPSVAGPHHPPPCSPPSTFAAAAAYRSRTWSRVTVPVEPAPSSVIALAPRSLFRPSSRQTLARCLDDCQDSGVARELAITEVGATACCVPMVHEALTESSAVELARAFKALGDPVRLRLLSLIAARG